MSSSESSCESRYASTCSDESEFIIDSDNEVFDERAQLRTIFTDIIPQMLSTPINGTPLVDLCGPDAEELDIEDHAELFANPVTQFITIMRDYRYNVVLRFFMATSQADLASGRPEPDELDALDIAYNPLLWMYLAKLMCVRIHKPGIYGSFKIPARDTTRTKWMLSIVKRTEDPIERVHIARRFRAMIYDNDASDRMAYLCIQMDHDRGVAADELPFDPSWPGVSDVSRRERARRSYLAKVDEIRRRLWNDDTDPGMIVRLWMDGDLASPLSPLT